MEQNGGCVCTDRSCANYQNPTIQGNYLRKLIKENKAWNDIKKRIIQCPRHLDGT